MSNDSELSRRSFFTAGAASIAAMGAGMPEAFAEPKKPGETRMLYFGGDYAHNGLGQEKYIRQTFSKSGIRLFFAQASRFITPEFLATVDLLMMNRVGDFDPRGYSAEGLVENRPEPDAFLTPEMEKAIIDNVRERGMGFVALHCTAGNLDNTELMKLIAVKPHKSGAIRQPVRHHDFNREHPITQGFESIEIELDENLPKEIDDDKAVRLFMSTGKTEGTTKNGGWCVERDKGRCVVLLAGHTLDSYKDKQYRQIHWRAAHWAMHRDIPPFSRG